MIYPSDMKTVDLKPADYTPVPLKRKAYGIKSHIDTCQVLRMSENGGNVVVDWTQIFRTEDAGCIWKQTAVAFSEICTGSAARCMAHSGEQMQRATEALGAKALRAPLQLCERPPLPIVETSKFLEKPRIFRLSALRHIPLKPHPRK